MNLKHKVTTWTLLLIAGLFGMSTLAASYTLGHPATSEAANISSGSGGVDQGANLFPAFNPNQQCSASVHKPANIIKTVRDITSNANGKGLRLDQNWPSAFSGTGIQQQLQRNYANPGNIDLNKAVAAFDNESAAYIEFSGVNPGYNGICSTVMFLVQSPSNPMSFYGIYTEMSPNGQRLDVVQETLLSTTPGELFVTVWSDSNSKTQTISVADPDTILNTSLFTPPSGGGSGGTTNTGGCIVNSFYLGGSQSSSSLASCLNSAGTNFLFEDAATIHFGANVYKATDWGATGSKARDPQGNDATKEIIYTLQPGGFDGAYSGGKTSFLALDTTKYTINIHTPTTTDMKKFFDSLHQAASSGTVNMKLYNYTKSNTNTASPYVLPVQSSNIDIFADYYGQDGIVSPLFVNGGTNELKEIGNYGPADANFVFKLVNPTLPKGCSAAASTPAFQLSSDPKTASNGSIMPAKWTIYDKYCNPYSGTVRVQDLKDAGAPTSGSQSQSGLGNTTTPRVNCHIGLFNPLSWFLCPLASGLESVGAGIDNAINAQLNFDTRQLDTYKEPFDNIRDVALGLIGVGALVAVISQAAGLEVFDAYTIRKILPRLFVCAIGISLSWPLISFFINLTNDLGVGIRSLIYLGAGHHGGTVNELPGVLGGGSKAFVTVVGIEAIASLGYVGLLSFAATAALAAAVAFLVLIIRQMVIVVLVIFAPIAIASYLLPNTQKMWKFWWDSFSKALLMFPMITALIAIGRVFASTQKDSLLSFVAYFAPYFLIPLTFRAAGGLLATLGGFVNDRSKGMFDGLKNFRGNTRKRRRQNALSRAQNQRIFRGAPPGSRRARINSAVQTATLLNRAGWRPSQMRNRIEGARSARKANELAEIEKHSEAFRAISGADDILEAAKDSTKTEDWVRHLQAKGYNPANVQRAVGVLKQAQLDLGVEGLQLAAAVYDAGTGTGYQGGMGQMADALEQATEGDGVLLANALVAARGKAEGSRRYDLVGAGFTDTFALIQRLARARTPQERAAMVDEISRIGGRITLEKMGIGALVGGRGQSGQNLLPAQAERLNLSAQAVLDAAVSADGTAQTEQYNDQTHQMEPVTISLEQAEREWVQNMAFTAAAVDIAGTAAPEIMRPFADQILDVQVDISKLSPDLYRFLHQDSDGSDLLTNSEVMRRLESHEAFGQVKKVYISQFERQQALGLAAGMPGAAGPQQVWPPQGMGGMPGGY